MKKIQIANIKTSFNDQPCGTRCFIGKKLYTSDGVQYMAYSDMKCNDGSFLGYFPKEVLQMLATYKVAI